MPRIKPCANPECGHGASWHRWIKKGHGKCFWPGPPSSGGQCKCRKYVSAEEETPWREKRKLIKVNFSIEELCFLDNLISGGVGGDPGGPRRIADSIQGKITNELQALGMLQYYNRPSYFRVEVAGHLEVIEAKYE